MLTGRRPRNARIVAAALGAVAACALALAPVASAQIAPPYTLTVGGGKVAVSPALGGSTIAISVAGSGGSVTFTPAATAIGGTDPGACTSGPLSTTCTAASMSAELRVEEILQVDIRGVATAKMALVGDADSDAIVVEGPAAPAQITLLDVFTGAGADALTVSGNVLAVQDDSGPADVSADRYVIDSPAITGALQPAGGSDYVEVRAGLLNLNGGDGVDTLIGPNGLNGGAGNDLLKPTAVGAQVDGGADIDRVSYERLAGDHVLVQSGSDVSIDGQPNVQDVEQVEAGPGNDTVTGDGAGNVLFGGAGNDVIAGGGGVDAIDGDAGADTVAYDDAGGVNVNLFTQTGGPAGAVDDLTSIEAVSTGPGPDTVVGTDAAESFALGAGNDVLDAGFGNDVADGGDGDDLLRGGRGTDQLTGGPGADTATYDERTSGEPVSVKLGAPGSGGTGAENDVLTTIENAVGTAGPDSLTGDGLANRLVGGAGTDTIDGAAGNDTLLGSGDRDIIDGGPGNDALFGETGDDTLKAFDSEQDTVDCGESPDDDAQVDPIDVVAGCEFSRRGDIPIPTDADGDGIAPPFDCDDTKATINPGATDVPADKIDQNCDGFDEALPFVPIRFALAWRSTSKGRRVGSLVASRLLPGHEIRMTCKPPKARKQACPFKRLVRKPKGSSQRLVLTSVFRRRALPKGTVVELRVTGPGHVGKLFTYTILSATAQREVRRCLTKGNSAKPAVCPAEEA